MSSVTKRYKVTRENKKDEKFAPQAQAILDAIKGFSEPVEREALLTNLEKTGALKTKQSPARVFSYFRPRLVESGILKEIKEVAPEIEKAPRTPKAPKTPKVPKASKGKKTEQK